MPNPPGRPPLDRADPSVPVMVKFPGRVFDLICKRATAERVTVPEFIRRALRNADNRKIQTSGH